MNTKVVLQAGGYGSRLRPLTENTPKPLIEVGGIPMVERLVRQLIKSDLLDITIIVGYLGDVICRYFSRLDDLPSDLKLSFIQETSPMGNIGSLRLVENDNDPVLLIFADLVTNINFKQLIEFHRSKQAEVTLASHFESHRVRLGELEFDGDKVLTYTEKPLKKFLICSGIALMEANVIELIETNKETGISELITSALDNNLQVFHWLHGSFWMDVNSHEALVEINSKIDEVQF